MTSDEYLVTLGSDSGRIAEIGATAWAHRVPSCPDWAVFDLMKHVGTFHRYVSYLAALPSEAHASVTGWTAAQEAAERVVRGADVVPWFRDGAEAMVQALRDADPDATTYTFYGVTEPALLVRRAVMETMIHRWDADGVLGVSEPLNPVLAAEGIDEFVDLLLPMPMFFRYTAFAGTGERIRLDATDHRDRSWVIAIDSETTVHSTAETDRKVDVSVRGGLSDLYLYLLGRGTAGPVDVRGKGEVLSRWRASIAF